jgi:TonB-dependent SusC/RagA subfamily outer membrane receptor
MKNPLVICLILLAGIAQGQDIFQKNLYSADRIMENREKLNLTDAQSAKIKKIHADNAADFSTLKWDLDAATARLKSMLEESKIDPTLVNKQMDEVLRLENLLKKKQLNTLVAIKNELSSPQQKMLEYNGNTATTVYGTGSYGKSNSAPLAISNFRVGVPTNSFEPQVSIKMYGSSNPDNSPLFIFKTDKGDIERRDVGDINPSDIESMSVLKGDAATKLYGEKGKDGVIVITLKKASKYFQEK